jgi:serine/threonine protein kinase/ABC-type phosphate/phosphonate transport system substrate-binding protein
MRGPEESLLGKYRIVREIGGGASGVVYAAVHTWTQRAVALKVLALDDRADRGSILRELRAGGRLVHSHAMTLIDADVAEDGSLFLVHQWLQGESLRDRLARGCLTVEETAETLLPIGEALVAAHSADIVHRDLKPSNVFLAEMAGETVPKLVDFAIGSIFAGMRVERSRAYLAPELARDGETIDPRVDVWSLAVLWLECLTGLTPARPIDLAERGHRVLERYGALDSVMPAPLRAVMARALEPDRRHRFTTMLEMQRALATALDRALEPSRLPEPCSVDLELSDEISLSSSAEARMEDTASDRPPPYLRDPLAATPSPIGALQALVSHGLQALRFGVVPAGASFHDPSVGQALARVLGAPVAVVRFGGYDELFAALSTRRVEVAWMPPVPFVRAASLGLVTGRLVSVRGGESSYVSVLLGHVARLRAFERQALRGRRAAWVDRWSAAGYLVPRRVLRARGIEPDRDLREQKMVGSHPAVVDTLLSGAADLGAVHGWRRDDGSVWHLGADHDELRTLAVSEPIPSDVMATNAQLPEPVARALVARLALLDPQDVASRSLLAAVGAEALGRFDPGRYLWIADAVERECPDTDPLGGRGD